uniref:Uncharacterized protein n=1 Tax=Plectus sambesii TaxID=2011161 RepID=A0A914VAD0_9BILA
MATPFPTFVPVTPPQTPVVAAGPAPNAFGPDQVAAPAPAPVAAPAEPPMNAQGGVAQDEDDLRERDWLDWIYTGIRAALLLTVIYFYTTPERLLGVALFILAMWAAQGGWNNFRRVQQPNNNNNAQQPAAGNVPVDENARQPVGDGNAEDDRVGDGEDRDRLETQPVVEPSAWVVFWSTCYTFVTSFFASLIPENPPPLNVN